MAKPVRGVGYCVNLECGEVAKGAFLFGPFEVFYCPVCRTLGEAVPEAIEITGPPEGQFGEVRVEFEYDPITRRFRSVAIVRDESVIGGHRVLTLRSPLIRTTVRALKVAECRLAVVAATPAYADPPEGASSTETVLSLDDSMEDFQRNLYEIARGWPRE